MLRNKNIRKQNKMNKFYLIVEDFVRAAVGPFDSRSAARAHYRWCKNVRGDGAELIGIVTEPGDLFLIDPVEDRDDWPQFLLDTHDNGSQN